MKKFLGLCITIDTVQMQSVKCNWSKQYIYFHSLFSKKMEGKRFKMILQCMCFYNENDDLTNNNHKISNIRENTFLTIPQKLYYPGRYLSIDEAL